MKSSVFVGLVFLVQLLAACGSLSPTGRGVEDQEPAQLPQEANLELPSFPQEGDLVEFFPLAVGSHRYFLDAKTLIVGNDRIVRYSMVVRTTGGAVNITYEGIHCQMREHRLYAVGYPEKGWIEARRSRWEPIRRGRFNDHQSFLFSEYFCYDGAVPVDKGTIVNALRQGLSAPSPHRGDR